MWRLQQLYFSHVRKLVYGESSISPPWALTGNSLRNFLDPRPLETIC
jgi:hypothetical protein